MTQLPTRRELQPLTRPGNRRIKSAETVWHRFVATITNPDLLTIIAICAIGLLITINVILRFPDLGALIERYNQF
jgi:hypothetical protein